MSPVEDPGAIRAALAAGEVRRLVVARVARLGDTLHVRPALALLRRALPGAEVTFVCSDYAAPVAGGAAADRVVSWPRGRGPLRAWGRRRALGRLRAGQGPFDLWLGLEDKPWARRAAAGLGCRFFHATSAAGAHVVERKAGVLVPLGLWDGREPPPWVTWAPGADARGPAALVDAPAPRIGLQAGSHATGWLAPRRRRDPGAAALVGIARALSEAGGTLFLHAGRGGPEGRLARAVAEQVGRETGRAPRLLEGLDVHALGAALAGLDLFVSANTGPLHLAAAVGTPVVLLEGPSGAITRPWCPPERLRVVSRGLDCSPCRGTPHGRRCPAPRCLDELDPAAVLAAARELLAAGRM